MKPIRKMVWCLAVLALLVCTGTSRAEFKVRKLVEIGRADEAPRLGAFKWTLDGSHLAYFADGNLMLADTNGLSREILQVEGQVVRCEWLDSNRLVIGVLQQTDANTEVQRISVVNVTLGIEETLESAALTGSLNKEGVWLNGPKRTLEGRPYYWIGREPGQTMKVITTSRHSAQSAAASPDQHILRWSRGSDGLYIVSLDGSDSTKIYDGKRPSGLTEVALSSDGKWWATDHFIRSVDSDSSINMTPFFTIPSPSNVYCGFWMTEFNPKRPEVLTEVTCDDGHQAKGNMVGIFDMSTSTLHILDTLINKSNCMSAEYSPDGEKILFRSNARVYVAFIESH